jgi:hypothetical protein
MESLGTAEDVKFALSNNMLKSNVVEAVEVEELLAA